MRKTLIILLLLFSVSAFSKPNLDSLYNALSNEKLSHEEKIKVCYHWASIYAASDLKVTYDIAKEGLKLAEKENNNYHISHFNSVIASTYVYRSSYDTAFVYLNKSLEVIKGTKNWEMECTVYMGIANIYARQGMYAEAVEYYMKILDLYEHTGPIRAYVLALGNIGEIHRRLNNPERAIYYLEQERILSDELNILTGQVQSYCELGGIYLQQGDIEKAYEYLIKVLDWIGLESPVWGNAANEVVAKIHIIRKEYGEALKCAQECVRYAEMLNDPVLFVTAWNLLATIYLEQQHYKEAESYATKAWEMDSVSIDTSPDVTFNIARANILLGNGERAYEFLMKNAEFNKKRTEKSLHETLLGMEIKYETEKKEMRITSLEKEKNLFIISGFIAAVLLLSLLFLYISKHRLLQARQMVAEQQVVLSEQKVKQLEQEKQIVASQAAFR